MRPETDLRRIALVGVGLIGGSFALAVREAYPDVSIAGFDVAGGALQEALALRVIDRAASSIADAVASADLVLIATPAAALPGIFQELDPLVGKAMLVADVSSTKQSAVLAARQHFSHGVARFVPCHPIAGSEKGGIGAADAALFSGKPVVLTPLEETEAEALVSVEAIWTALGCVVHPMTPLAHDELFAYLSHAPHLIAYAWVGLGAQDPLVLASIGLAGTGFRDFTRIAASDAALWTDIVLDNRDAIDALLAQHVETIGTLRQALSAGRRDEVLTLFSGAASVRRALA